MRRIMAVLFALGLLGASDPPLAAPVLSAQEIDTPQPDTASPAGALEGEAPEPVSPQQEEQDQEIRSRLQAIYDRIGTLQDVSVEMEAGIVQLTGQALSLEARERAVELARETEGVVFVEDRLRVVTDLAQRLEPAADRLREYALGAVAFLPLLLVALLIVAGFGLLGGWISRKDGPHLHLARTPFIRGLLRQAIQAGFTLTGVLVALELLDATALVGAVLGTAGVFGLALGFAFKDIVENHLAGIMLSVRQPFAPNDHILVGDHEGKIVRLTARETILMTHAGNHVRIPNAELFRSVITNYTRNPRRRFDIAVSVGTDGDLGVATEAGTGALRAMEGVMADPAPSSTIDALGESWVTLEFYGWVDQRRADFPRVRSEAIRLVKRALERAGISMPPPEYSVLLQEHEAPPAAAPPEEREREALLAAAEQQDVSVDTTLDDQIEEDRRGSDEADLLEPENDMG